MIPNRRSAQQKVADFSDEIMRQGTGLEQDEFQLILPEGAITLTAATRRQGHSIGVETSAILPVVR
jgi:hypothetical protein